MQLELNWCYKFCFTDPFDKLDNVYRLTKILTYEEMLNEGITLSSLYSLVGKTDADLEKDYIDKNYANERIYKLVHPTILDTVFYVPKCLLASVPNPSVKEYAKLVVSFNIGIYPGEEDLSYIKNEFGQQLRDYLGYTKDPDIFSISTQWLTDEDYQKTVDERNANKAVDENGNYKVLSYFSAFKAQEKEILNLKAKVAAYENIITNYLPNVLKTTKGVE